MVQLRSSRYIICFYCGKKSGLRKDSQTRSFTCENCDATNYLDKNGEITDPPVTKTSSDSPKKQYARNSQPPQADSVFCDTCLKNQRLFTASLAQYDEPADSNREAERKYYQWRKQLELRYPQVCDDCKKRVEQKIREARYTAQTDHLRRMRDRTRETAGAHRTWTILDVLDRFGHWAWTAAFLLQLVWHLEGIATILTGRDDGMYDPDDKTISTRALLAMGWLARHTPADAVWKGSLLSGLVAIWWNPYFVQVNRGFTRHLSGFRQWYALQALVALLRWVLPPLFELQQGSGVQSSMSSSSSSSSRQAALSAHGGIMALTFLIHHISRKCITADTRPLFGSETRSSMPLSTAESSPTQQNHSPKGFAETLSQALDFTPPKRALPSEPQLRPLGNPYPPNQPFRSSKPGLSKFESRSSASLFNNNNSDENASAADHAEDEMDWAPTTSSHRAFQPSNPDHSGTKLFGDAPVAPEQGPFWYKAPSAPQHPAHRLRNPPRMPVIQSQAELSRSRNNNSNNTAFSFSNTALSSADATGNIATTTGSQADRGVTFTQPRFFANEGRGAEEANSLADMFGGAFSVRDPTEGPGNDGGKGGNARESTAAAVTAAAKRRGIFTLGEQTTGGDEGSADGTWRNDGTRQTTEMNTWTTTNTSATSVTTLAILALWVSWILASSEYIPWSARITQPGILVLSALVSGLGLSRLAARLRTVQGKGSLLLLTLLALRAGEAIGAIWVVWRSLSAGEEEWTAGHLESWGGGLVCFMVGHQVVESAM